MLVLSNGDFGLAISGADNYALVWSVDQMRALHRQNQLTMRMNGCGLVHRLHCTLCTEPEDDVVIILDVHLGRGQGHPLL